ncbi:DNA polymerase III subunit gamma/tau [Thermovenabulum gondwanense]|uniref:DNA-directed DNA polymerase n=1 Tax=Thermovenabulum gondwanense TaxID=520767 RepID=A0A162MHW4_9FIRM|nr:DNA polymerase III subunit gamma/tau [Thermovenabulum gondwanense]KYO66105.1 DNA polymerase III subunit gamma/tau [Thermovenabulum gondwanense]
MTYLALYRKYRPSNFDEIVGQRPIVRVLKNQLKSGKIGHAYLFCGMRGTGKTSTARVFAKALNCEKGPTDNPCGVCRNCLAFQNGSFMDIVEMDAASHRGIDDIRDLREKVNFPPSQGRYRVYIIDEVHMLTQEAFNALLKTLEEPPKHTVFILCTTEPNKLPATILSRCMRFDFKRVSLGDIAEHLKRISQKQGLRVDDRAVKLIARHSQGSIRDSLSLLDKASGTGSEVITYEDVLEILGAVEDEVFIRIALAVKEGNPGEVLTVIEGVFEKGKDINRFVEDLMYFFRNLLLLLIKCPPELIDLPLEEILKLKEIASKYKKEEILQILDILKAAANEVKWTAVPRIVLESALVKLTMLSPPVSVQKEYIKSEGENKAGCDKERDAQHEKNQDVAEREKEKEKKEDPKEDKKSGRSASKTEEKEGEEEKTKKKEDEALELIKAKWQDVVDFLSKNGKMLLTSMITSFKVLPEKMQKNHLTLSAQEASQGQLDFIKSQKKLIEEAIKIITGLEVNVQDVKIKGTEGKKEREMDDDLVENVIKLFGKDIVEIKED